MQLSETMERALNEQINAEMYSAYLYLSMSSHFKGENLDGFAAWFLAQAREEMFHAEKFYHFVHRRGGKVALTAIDAPPAAWNSPLAAFENVLAHEQHVTGLIHKLVDLALNERDHATTGFLQWFVDEQVEEEENASGIVEQLRRVGDSTQGLFMMDRELGTRTFTAETE